MSTAESPHVVPFRTSTSWLDALWDNARFAVSWSWSGERSRPQRGCWTSDASRVKGQIAAVGRWWKTWEANNSRGPPRLADAVWPWGALATIFVSALHIIIDFGVGLLDLHGTLTLTEAATLVGSSLPAGRR